MLLSVWASDVVGLNRDAAIDGAPEVMHLDLSAAAIERYLGDAGDLRSRIVDERKSKAATVAFPAPIRHLRHALDHLRCTRRALHHSETKLHGIDAVLERDLIHERFRREFVGRKADAAKRRRAHAGILVELARSADAARRSLSNLMPSIKMKSVLGALESERDP